MLTAYIEGGVRCCIILGALSSACVVLVGLRPGFASPRARSWSRAHGAKHEAYTTIGCEQNTAEDQAPCPSDTGSTTNMEPLGSPMDLGTPTADRMAKSATRLYPSKETS